MDYEKTTKAGGRGKPLKARWKNGYLIKFLKSQMCRPCHRCDEICRTGVFPVSLHG